MKINEGHFSSRTVIIHFWDLTSYLNISHRKISDYVSFLLPEFTLVIRLANFDFESSWSTLKFLTKKMMSDLIMPCQTVPDLA